MSHFQLRGANITYCDGQRWDNPLPTCLRKRSTNLSFITERTTLAPSILRQIAVSSDQFDSSSFVRLRRRRLVRLEPRPESRLRVETAQLRHPQRSHRHRPQPRPHQRRRQGRLLHVHRVFGAKHQRHRSPHLPRVRRRPRPRLFRVLLPHVRRHHRQPARLPEEGDPVVGSEPQQRPLQQRRQPGEQMVPRVGRSGTHRRRIPGWNPRWERVIATFLFQIVVEGVRGSSYVSDIAIDDVRIIRNCSPEDEVEQSTT
jgi:hypothetical protein